MRYLGSGINMAEEAYDEITLINKIVEDCKKNVADAKINGKKSVICGTAILGRYDPNNYGYHDKAFYQDYQITVPWKSEATSEAFWILNDFYRKEQSDGTMRVHMSRYMEQIRFLPYLRSGEGTFIGHHIHVRIDIKLEND